MTRPRGLTTPGWAIVGMVLLAASVTLLGFAEAQPGPPGKVEEIDLDFEDPHLIVVSWLPPSDAGGLPVTGYRVYARTEDSPSQPGSGVPFVVAEAPGEARNATISAYPTGTTVMWSVSALTAAGEGPRSHEMTTRIPPVYGPPQRLRATLGEHRVLLAWDEPADVTTYSHAPSYDVHRKTGRDGAFGLLATTYGLALEDVDPPDGTFLAYVVVANTTGGAGPPSEPVELTTPLLPAAPLHLRATPGPGRVALAWDAPPPDGEVAQRFRIYRGELGDETASFLREVVGVHEWTDRDLPEDVTFFYAVLAANDWGEGPFSEAVRVTTPSHAGVPAPPSDVSSGSAAASSSAAPPFWLTAPVNWTLGTVVTTLVGGSILALRTRRQALKTLVEERAPLLRATPEALDALRAYLAAVRAHNLGAPPGIRAARRRLESAMEALPRAAVEARGAAHKEFERARRAFLAELERHARRWRIPVVPKDDVLAHPGTAAHADAEERA